MNSAHASNEFVIDWGKRKTSKLHENQKSDFLIIINNKDVFQIVYCITLGSVYETTNVSTDVNQKLLLSRPAPRPLELRATYSGQENH